MRCIDLEWMGYHRCCLCEDATMYIIHIGESYAPIIRCHIGLYRVYIIIQTSISLLLSAVRLENQTNPHDSRLLEAHHIIKYHKISYNMI